MRRSIDRREGDRRQGYDLEKITMLGCERRKTERRSSQGEKRGDWVRVTRWSSVKITPAEEYGLRL